MPMWYYIKCNKQCIFVDLNTSTVTTTCYCIISMVNYIEFCWQYHGFKIKYILNHGILIEWHLLSFYGLLWTNLFFIPTSNSPLLNCERIWLEKLIWSFIYEVISSWFKFEQPVWWTKLKQFHLNANQSL